MECPDLWHISVATKAVRLPSLKPAKALVRAPWPFPWMAALIPALIMLSVSLLAPCLVVWNQNLFPVSFCNQFNDQFFSLLATGYTFWIIASWSCFSSFAHQRDGAKCPWPISWCLWKVAENNKFCLCRQYFQIRSMSRKNPCPACGPLHLKLRFLLCSMRLANRLIDLGGH
jgi:hypothetical protein